MSLRHPTKARARTWIDSRWKAAVPAALALCLVVAATGCGGGGPSENVVSVRGDEYAFLMPDRLEGGLVTMEVSNTGEELHEYALGRLAPGKTIEDVRRLLESGVEEPPPWVTDVGGVPLLEPGEEVSITRELEPATYVMLCFIPAPDGKPHVEHGMLKSFEVVGESNADPPEADATITVTEDGFEVPAIEPGRRTIELRNAAAGERDFNLVVFAGGKQITDLGKWFESGMAGPAPAEFLGGLQIVPAGTSVFMTTHLEAGTTYSIFETATGTVGNFRPS